MSPQHTPKPNTLTVNSTANGNINTDQTIRQDLKFAPHSSHPAFKDKSSLIPHINATPLPTSAGAAADARPVTPVTPNSHPRKPSEAGLYLQTDVSTPAKRTSLQAVQEQRIPIPEISHPADADVQTPRPWPLQHTRSFDSVVSATSSLASPALAALTDVTPLPSPITIAESPELWRRAAGRPHSGSNASLSSLAREEMAGYLSPAALSTSPAKKRRAYAGLGITGASAADRSEEISRTRTISEYVPDPLVNIRPRTRTITGASPLHNSRSHHDLRLDQQSSRQSLSPPEIPPHHMHRELYLARQRGFLEDGRRHSEIALPTPPLSNRSVSGEQEEQAQAGQEESSDLLIVRDTTTKVKNYWRPLRKLGQGAFSEVFLAKRELPSDKELFAIKVVSHVPTADHDDERMEASIQREIEMLQSISHPCLPQLKAFDDNDKRALLVLNYCPGGDLFELASQRRDILTPVLIQRIFAELVAAVAYLHSQLIVHRDIKLENVLFNIPASDLSTLTSPLSHHPKPLITLTDLGLSKRISPPPASPLLTHACGSADYAAPELLLGQPYDGRLTDAWALGVVLYALMEGRLPFDPLPVSEGMSGAGRRRRGQHVSVKHRIARCDWLWCEFGNDEGEWSAQPGEDGELLNGASEVVHGCLKKVGRGRWTVLKCRGNKWVRGGLAMDWAGL